MNKIILPALAVVGLVMANQSMSAVNEYSCELDFEFDSAVVDAQKLEGCFQNLEKEETRFFHIFATASYPGTLEYNRELSDKRAAAIRSELEKKFPGSKIETMGGGESPLGQKAKVFALTASAETVAVPATPSVGNTIVSPRRAKVDSPYRMAVRGGVDRFRDSETNYSAIGAEVSRRSKTWRKHYFGEAGVGYNHYSHDDMLDAYSANGFVGGYRKIGIAAVGIRGFAGNLGLQNGKDNVFNGGGELRLGVEQNRYSAFLSGGVSKETTGAALDVGVKF